MSDFEVIRGHGVPTRCWSKYPFFKLEVGDAFRVPEGNYGTIRTLASRYNGRGGRRFTVRKQDDGAYVVVRLA